MVFIHITLIWKIMKKDGQPLRSNFLQITLLKDNLIVNNLLKVILAGNTSCCLGPSIYLLGHIFLVCNQLKQFFGMCVQFCHLLKA